jgi:predicted XRE-type DNA-binding protein
MSKAKINGVDVELGSGNVFADLKIPQAEKLKIKSGLVIEISRAISRLDLSQMEASKRMGIAQSKVSALLSGDFANLSERKLMDCLTRLGYDIEIKVKQTKHSFGQLTLLTP